MGRLTAELPDGSVHVWENRDPIIITRFLGRFRQHVERYVTHDPEIQKQAAGRSLDTLVEHWIFWMTRHVLTTAVRPEVQQFHKMFLTYRLLTLEVPPESGYPGKTFADLLPGHNIEFRLSAPDGNFAFEFHVL